MTAHTSGLGKNKRRKVQSIAPTMEVLQAQTAHVKACLESDGMRAQHFYTSKIHFLTNQFSARLKRARTDPQEILPTARAPNIGYMPTRRWAQAQEENGYR